MRLVNSVNNQQYVKHHNYYDRIEKNMPKGNMYTNTDVANLFKNELELETTPGPNVIHKKICEPRCIV